MYDRSVLERQHRKVHKNKNAEVAELADAQASGACGSNTVRVQVPPSAPDNDNPNPVPIGDGFGFLVYLEC